MISSIRRDLDDFELDFWKILSVATISVLSVLSV